MNVEDRVSVLTPLTQMMLIGGGFVLIVAGLRAGSEIINIILLAYIVTLLAAPLYRQFIRWHLPPFAAVLLVLLLCLIMLLGLGVFLTISLGRLEASLSQYQSALTDKALALAAALSEDSAALSDTLLTSGGFDFQSMISNAFGFVTRVISSFARLFTNMGLVVLIVFFALFEVTAMPERLIHGLGADHTVLQRFYRLSQSIRTYFWIKTLAGLTAAVANTVLLLALGVEFAFLWGVLSFLFNYIPNIGFIIALAPAALIALLQFGVAKALIVIAGYVVVNFLMDNVLSPKFMGRGINLSPLIVFIALIFWSWVLGVLGAILAVPFMLIIRTLLESDENMRWLSLIISDSA